MAGRHAAARRRGSWGAGAVVDAIVSTLEHRAGPMLLSAEAAVALAAWSWVGERVGPSLEACASGREIIDLGFGDDADRRGG